MAEKACISGLFERFLGSQGQGASRQYRPENVAINRLGRVVSESCSAEPPRVHLSCVKGLQHGSGEPGHVLAFESARLESRIARGDLRLRLYRFRDLPALRCLLQPEVFSAASGSQVKAFGSSAALWRWVRRTFQVFYVIEVDKRERRSMIGFAGIYNIEPGNSLWVSLVIFDPKDRRHGYGGRALELLLSSLQKNHAVKRVCGEVLASNAGSLRFLKKLGFDILAEDRNRLLLKF